MTKNPFTPFGAFNPETLDFSKFDFAKMFDTAKLPVADTEALVAGQRKNIDALTEANRIAVAGLQTVAKRQAEILTAAMSSASAAAKELSGTKDARELMAKQADMTKEAFEKALADMRELAEAVTKSANEAMEVVNKRVIEGLDEVKSLGTKK